MSDVNDHPNDSRWSDNAAECPYCGTRVPFITSRECASCAAGRTVAREADAQLDRPTESFYYSRAPLTPCELAEYRAKCAAFDAEQLRQSEPTPEAVIEEALSYRR